MYKIATLNLGEYLQRIALYLNIVVLCVLSCAAQDNGIAVSEPKVFDNRVLLIRLEELNKRLQAIQVVDQQKLLQSLGLFQGSQIREVARSLSVGTIPIPAVKTTRKPDAAGELQTSEEVTDRKETSASAPALPNQLAAPKYEPPYGISAEDALQEQVNLTYQIYNLQMLLERSLSDRLFDNPDKKDKEPRLQGLLNFHITLDPPNEAKDAAAFVEVTVTPVTPAKDNKPVSLVALMPQEKTYNATALRSKSNAFGGSAVLKVITVGYSEQRRGQTFYLYQDADTLTFRRMAQISPTFGWEFRPVLGRRSVSPGTKQMFAVIALPDSDKFKGDKLEFEVEVKVKTYWRKYNHDRLTTSSQNMDKAELAASEYSFKTAIPYSSVIDDKLKPKVTSVKWYPTGDKSAVVVVQGENFYSGSKAILGDVVYDDADSGLVIKSSQQMQIETSLDALASSEILINGRYGESNPLHAKTLPAGSNPNGIEFNGVSSNIEPGRKIGTLMIQLIGKNNSDLPLSSLPYKDYYPIIRVQNTAIKGPYNFQQVACNGDKICTLIQAPVPAELLNSDSIASIRFPFLGGDWTDSMPFLVTEAPLKLSKLSKTGNDTTLAITGRVFDIPGWTVQIGANKITPKVVEKTLLTFDVPTASINNDETIIVLPPLEGKPVTLALKLKAEPVSPELDKDKNGNEQVAAVNANSAVGVEFKGKGLGAVKEVAFEDEELQFAVKDDGKTIVIYLTRSVTEKAGTIQVLLRTGNVGDAPIPATVTIK